MHRVWVKPMPENEIIITQVLAYKAHFLFLFTFPFPPVRDTSPQDDAVQYDSAPKVVPDVLPTHTDSTKFVSIIRLRVFRSVPYTLASPHVANDAYQLLPAGDRTAAPSLREIAPLFPRSPAETRAGGLQSIPEVRHQDSASVCDSQHDPPPITAPAPHSLYRVSSVKSVDALRSAIASYIDSSPLYDFRLCSKAEVLEDRTIWKSLQSAIRNRKIRGITVNVQHPSIKIHGKSRPLHDAVASMLCDFLDLAKQVFPEHKSKLRAHCTGERLASVTRTRPWAKYSDISITYGSPGDKLRPTLIFEVGASEPHEDLVEDAKQWLVAGREAQLVVLIDIQEDREALGTHRKTKDFQDRFCQLVLNYAREDAIDQLGIQDDFGEMYSYFFESEPEDYLDLQNDLVQVDFVGPIEVTLELWALENGLLQRRSSHQVIPPRDDIVEFNASDLIPQELVNPER